MGDYATTSSLSQLMPNALSGGTTTGDAEAVATFSKHITRAEGEIKAVLALRYSLPFSPVPPAVISWAEDLACYHFLRAAVAQDGGIKSESLLRFEPAYTRLVAAQKGGFSEPLSYTDGSIVPRKTSSRILSTHENEGPVFELDEPESWKVDPDKEDRLADLRD